MEWLHLLGKTVASLTSSVFVRYSEQSLKLKKQQELFLVEQKI